MDGVSFDTLEGSASAVVIAVFASVSSAKWGVAPLYPVVSPFSMICKLPYRSVSPVCGCTGPASIYIALLLLLPVVVRWRWGLVAALVVAVAELAVVALVFYLLNAYVFPDQFAGERPPRAPIEIMRRGYERSAVA